MSGGSDPVDGRARVHVHVSGRVQGVAYRAARVDSVAVTDESPGGLDCFEVRR